MLPNPSQYIVRVYATPMSFPLNFTVHTWVEISHENQTERYDLWGYPGLKTTSEKKGYLYKNIFPDHLGTTLSPLGGSNTPARRQTGTVILEITSQHHSAAKTLYEKIAQHAFAYPHYALYRMILGPNCNTYTQWLLDLVPEAGLHLPWYAWGKTTFLHRKNSLLSN
jgi:hypothetical protein